MRIRKNRTSSRVIPEFCVTHVEKVDNLKHVDAARFDPPPLLVLQQQQKKEKHPIRKQQQQQPLDVDELELDAAAILNSLDNESSSYKIRDFVLAQGDNAKPQGGGSENNHNCVSRLRQSGSESDTGHAAGSRKRIVKHAADARSSKSTSVSGGDKINSDTTSKAMAKAEEIESAHEQTLAKSEVIDDPPPPLTKKPTTVDSGNTRSVFVCRKRHRRQVESDSSPAQEIGTKSEDEDYKYCGSGAGAGGAANGAAAEKLVGKVVAKEESMQVEGTERCPTANFPMGWSYRGLAQIAEHDKATQGKQCGRTDGRSWRCPLKVLEGFTLCEHHLTKFRLKKLCKGNKKQKASPQQSRDRQHQQQQQQQQQQIQQQQQQEQHHHQQQQQQQHQQQRSPPSPPSPPPQSEISKAMPQSPTTTLEHDVPMKFRRRHKTVKLSVL
ncbi:hypothetical protein Mapa_014184 [Marchantia paleacea]|nr:hypothetical protein Mapa_014184 [Marchantia paleacea]